MTRREFMAGAVASAGLAGCCTEGKCPICGVGGKGGILFGACRPLRDAALLKSVGFDFIELGCAAAFIPDKDSEAWKRQRDAILAAPVPVRSCNGFIPGTFRLTGPKADFAPALAYGETVLRRADEVGVKTIVFGSGGARNVPGDYTVKDQKPDVEKGAVQYADFCRELCRRTADLKGVTVVIEPLRPNESNIVNYVWQGVQICNEVNSPRLNQLADIFHMMMGRETADSIRLAGKLLRHCHVADYGTRSFPGADPSLTAKLAPYFEALRDIGYAGGVSCECSWGKKEDLSRNLETALKTMRGLV